MQDFVIEQARWFRDDKAAPRLAGRSPGFLDAWLPLAQELATGFGERPVGGSCPAAVFARPLGAGNVAIVQVADRVTGGGVTLGFHMLVLAKADYEAFVGDPFWLAAKFPAAWDDSRPLESLSCPRTPLPPRTVQDVQRVLRRVKASALQEDEDPEADDFERTVENSESPALLGGAQVLVEGGKLVFERSAPDTELLRGLWTLLPNSARARLWPASFAFANDLRFDALIVPRLREGEFQGYTSEDRAAEYPAGQYEMNLQIAAETGDQDQLDRLLNSRSTGETLRLAWLLVILFGLLALAPKFAEWLEQPPATVATQITPGHKAAVAAGVVAVGDPWSALARKLHGDALFQPSK